MSTALLPEPNTRYRPTKGVPSDVLLDVAFRKVTEVFNLPQASEIAKRYQDAAPFPYLVIDNFFSSDLLEHVAKELVAEDVKFSKVFSDDLQRNKTISTGDAVPPLISLLASKFAAPDLLRYLEEVTGLKRLLPDPYYNTEYGYYHIVGSGGVLGSHVDHSHHGSLNIPHVLNLVVYLTQNWDEVQGGSLCLFDRSGKNVAARIPCVYNRAILFACCPTAYHGVDPISESSRRRRHSLYFAYYSVETYGVQAQASFPGLDEKTSNLDSSVSYGTYFVVPFWQLFRPGNWVHLRTRLIYLGYLLLPPLLIRVIKKLMRSDP